MISRRTRLHQPGFALWAFLLAFASSSLAANLKPVHSFHIKVPDIYNTINAGPFGLAYVRPGQLAIWFTDKTEGELSSRGELRPTDPWRMKLQLLDTATGATETREWPTRKLSSGLAVGSDGTVVVLNGPLVRCLANDLRPAGSTKLSDPSARQNERVLRSSPGGKLATVLEAADRGIITHVNPQACRIEDTLATPVPVNSLTANDSLLVASNGRQLGSRTTHTNWRLLYQPNQCCLLFPRFVSQNLIMAYRDDRQGRRGLLIVDTLGKLVLDDPLEGDYREGPIVPSNNGQLVAVATPKIEFLSQRLDLGPVVPEKYRVRLYDLRTLTHLADVEIPSNHSNLFALAISPDGRQIAALAGPKILIYEIPQ